DYSQVSYSSARASANESWRYFLGRRRFIAGRLATQMFSCWLEQALLRYIAAGLGVSYEQLSRDYSQVSYSSARASANESWRY
ncbi:phage portal protein, partial [Salmonella enterica]